VVVARSKRLVPRVHQHRRVVERLPLPPSAQRSVAGAGAVIKPADCSAQGCTGSTYVAPGMPSNPLLDLLGPPPEQHELLDMGDVAARRVLAAPETFAPTFSAAGAAPRPATSASGGLLGGSLAHWRVQPVGFGVRPSCCPLRLKAPPTTIQD
jgi:hypothetical protein